MTRTSRPTLIDTAPTPSERVQRFARILLVIVVVALGVRVAYVAIAKHGPCRVFLSSGPSKCLAGDELYYNAEANYLANGHGFNEPLAAILRPGQKSPPSAAHPPATVVVLTSVSWLTAHPPFSWWIKEGLDDHVREHRYAMAVLGTFSVLLIGLLGRRVAGDTIGLVAAGIAAVSPLLWVTDGLVMSETITSLTVVGALLCAFAFRDRPSVRRAVMLGAICGIAGLARVEFTLLIPLLALVVPFTLALPAAQKRLLAAVAAATAIVVMSPWVLFNLARFHDTTFVSTNDGITLAGANCDNSYYGKGIGLWQIGSCTGGFPSGDESQASTTYRHRAFDYIGDHLDRVPVVVVARVARQWNLYRPFDMVRYNTGEDREEWATRIGLLVFYPTALAAVAGVVALRRRRARFALWVTLVPAIVVTVFAALTYGNTRFRSPAEPVLAILAAVGAVSIVRARRPAPESLTMTEERPTTNANSEGSSSRAFMKSPPTRMT